MAGFDIYIHDNNGSPKAWAIYEDSKGYFVIWGSWRNDAIVSANSQDKRQANGDAKRREKLKKGYLLEHTLMHPDAFLDKQSNAYRDAIRRMGTPTAPAVAPAEPEVPHVELVWGELDKNVPWSF
jgi:hypothetical protein